MRALLLDVETTGLDPETCTVIEAAGALVTSDDSGRWRVLRFYSGTQTAPAPLSPEITRLTGLTDQDLDGERIACQWFRKAAADADVLVAWNYEFDRAFLAPILGEFADSKPWADAMRHIDWGARGAKHLGLDYVAPVVGRVMNPCPHSAAGDVLTMAALIGPHLSAMVARAQLPEVDITAVSAPFDAKDALKARAYRWQAGPKVWSRRILESELDDERAWLSAAVYRGQSRAVIVAVPSTWRHEPAAHGDAWPAR